MRLHWLVARPQVSPVLGVVVRIDHCEYCMLHVSVLQIAGHVEKIEFHRLPIGRHSANHARPIIRITIVGQQQRFSVDQNMVMGSSGLPAPVASCMSV